MKFYACFISLKPYSQKKQTNKQFCPTLCLAACFCAGKEREKPKKKLSAMVIKVAYGPTPNIRLIPKRHPRRYQITKPGRGVPHMVKNKWTRLFRVFNREKYTNWFGNSRFIMLVNLEKTDKYFIHPYLTKLRPLGCNMIATKQDDAFIVLKRWIKMFWKFFSKKKTKKQHMGLEALGNALKTSYVYPTMLVYAYGNEYSPLGNLETLPLLKQIIQIFSDTKRKPHEYIVAGAIDKQVLSANELVKLLDMNDPVDYWQGLGSQLNSCLTSVPAILNAPSIQLVNLLQYYQNHGFTDKTT
ncbi:hypothetical protein RFI_25078 [Reticulomyxa filosa]|uniref:Uncharacterized protein n=1 Tax=Reticulomyxa filosa TaxID=46433 RepID=X6MFU2_RETFI|nr:hypothetical protein RFI_25078 [Reticulomyxa filosa]|eukprot:ETO12297.1 hypothetical protein RFI_25078 [Reticulomyxa filosa]